MSSPLGVFLLHLQQSAVLAADADRLDAQLFHQLDQAFVDLIQDHLRNLHGRLIRHTQAVDKLRFHADFVRPSG